MKSTQTLMFVSHPGIEVTTDTTMFVSYPGIEVTTDTMMFVSYPDIEVTTGTVCHRHSEDSYKYAMTFVSYTHPSVAYYVI